MSHLTLSTLGMPEVRHNGKALQFRTRKSLALLIYLAVEGRLHSREKLTAFFWPETGEERGRSMLRRTLAYLRQTLNETSEPSGEGHIVVAREMLGFNTGSDYTLDLRLLEGAGLPEQEG